MAVTLIQGSHLTARDKQIISHMVAHDMATATAPRAVVNMQTIAAGLYRVTFDKPESDDWGRRTIRRQSALVICDEKGTPAFADARALRDELRAAADAASHAINSIEGVGSLTMGLTPDHIKARPEYCAADRDYKRAADALRAINAWLMRHYKADSRAAALSEREAMRRAA